MEKFYGIKKNKKTGRYSSVLLNEPMNKVKKVGKIKLTKLIQEEKEIIIIPKVEAPVIEAKKEAEPIINIITAIKRNRKNK